MDERVFRAKIGQPIPIWDGNHRLPIDGNVSSACADDGTVFSINSIFMDVSDQPFSSRQWMVAAVLMFAFGATALLFLALLPFLIGRFFEDVRNNSLWILFNGVFASGFGFFVFQFGRDEFFSLTRRTIRFHRKDQKIFLIRRRRFFSKRGDGDVCWEIPWDNRVVFCVHRGENMIVDFYHIRGYEVDEVGNVIRAFSIGRCWTGVEELPLLLAQWNFYCTYMAEGPQALPSPMLYLSEKENATECFLHSMYDCGRNRSAAYRIVHMPLFLALTLFRMLSLATCRDPVWPENVERRCYWTGTDTWAQPIGRTPIGWAQTTYARNKNEYPTEPRKQIEGWTGANETDNARLWAADKSPLNYELLYPAEVCQ